MSEEIIYEEPSKEIKIGDVNITLVNELIQKIDESVNVSFMSDSSMDEIKIAFETCESFTYGEDVYEGYSFVKSFEMEVDNTGQTIYRIDLEKPEQETELTEDQTFAINYAVMTMSDTDALEHMSIFPTWKSFINQSMPDGQRFVYENELWKSRQEIKTVLENQPPSIETASLYERIDEEHAGTYDDPIPYANTMEVFNGKYYIEDEIIYKCIRDSGQPLYATCASLVGNYFEVAEEE